MNVKNSSSRFSMAFLTRLSNLTHWGPISMKTLYLIGSVVQIIHVRNLCYQTLVAFEPHLPYKNGCYVHSITFILSIFARKMWSNMFFLFLFLMSIPQWIRKITAFIICFLWSWIFLGSLPTFLNNSCMLLVLLDVCWEVEESLKMVWNWDERSLLKEGFSYIVPLRVCNSQLWAKMASIADGRNWRTWELRLTIL